MLRVGCVGVEMGGHLYCAGIEGLFFFQMSDWLQTQLRSDTGQENVYSKPSWVAGV